MTRVHVSSSQVIDQLWLVKGINGEMSKHTSKQTDNIGTTPKCQKGKNLEGKEIQQNPVVRPNA